MAQTKNKQSESKKPKKPKKYNAQAQSNARIERNLKAYSLHLSGLSVRGICEELGLKSSQTGYLAIQRGKEYAIDKGVDVAERRVEIDQLFKRTLCLLTATAEMQHAEGQLETIQTPEGTITKRKRGICPRIAGELSRSLNRWAEFSGLLDRAPEISTAATLVQLAAPATGADFSDRWDKPSDPVVDVSATTAEAAPALPAPAEG